MKRFALLALMLFSLRGWSDVVPTSNNWCVYTNGLEGPHTTWVNYGTSVTPTQTNPGTAPYLAYPAQNCVLVDAQGVYGSPSYVAAHYTGCTCPQNVASSCLTDGSCPEISDTTSFKFGIESGGYAASLYVCGVCIKPHVCTDCGKDLSDKIVVYASEAETEGTNILATITSNANNTEQCASFTQAQHANHANVFLNSVEYGSGWYVKYCLNIVHGVAGNYVDGIPGPASVNFGDNDHLFGITGLVTVTPGTWQDNGYLQEAGLQFSVNHYCGTKPTTDSGFLGDADDNSTDHINFWDEVLPGQVETVDTAKRVCVDETGTTGCFLTADVCKWEVHFQESKRCPRRLKEPCTGTDCKLFKSEVNTTVKATIKPTCTDCTTTPI